MDLSMKAIWHKDLRMVMVSINGLTSPYIKATGGSMNFMEMENILGVMEGSLLDSGVIIWCTEQVNYNTKMDAITRVNINMTKSMEKVSSPGLQENSMMVDGSIVNSMALGHWSVNQVMKITDYGKTVNA